MTLRFLEIPQAIKEKINFSRYSLVPLCNLSEDAPLTIIDTLYARNLSLSRHVLWYSDTQKPDLGGHEEKDFRAYFQEELENPEVCKKGFYRHYCVEIDLSILALNTIMQAEFLKEFEEATNVAAQQNTSTVHDKNQAFGKFQSAGEFDTDLDEYVSCAPVFQKLRDLCNLWVKDVLNGD